MMQALGEPPPSGIALPIGDLSNLVASEIPFPDSPVPAEENHSTLWATINFVRGIESKSGTYNALVGSGAIGLIRDHELMSELHNYYRLSNAVNDVQDKFFSFGDDSLIGVGRRYGLSPFEGVEVDRLITLVSENPELAVYLRQERQKAALQSGLVAGLDRRAAELISIIDGAGD